MASTSRPSPALPPPPGQSSNFVNPESLLMWDIVCITVCLVFTTVFFILRTYVRLGVHKQWILEDYMCCVSYAGLVVFCVLTTITMENKGGVHEWNLTKPQSYTVIYWFNATSIEYAYTILCTKLTVLLLYRRVFLPHRWGTFDIILRVFMLVVSLYYTITAFLKVWECVPRPRIWNKTINGTCISVSGILNTDGVFNTLSDFLIIVVPMKAIWTLQMKRNKKIGIFLLFTVGLIAPIFSIIGWVVRLRNSSNPDITHDQPQILLWGAAEVTAGIICTCLPTLPTLLRPKRASPSPTALKSSSTSRHLRSSGRKQTTNTSDQDFLNREYIELGEQLFNPTDLRALPSTVVAIKGGASPPNIHPGEALEAAAQNGEPLQGSRIMKTVDIAQSCVRADPY